MLSIIYLNYAISLKGEISIIIWKNPKYVYFIMREFNYTIINLYHTIILNKLILLNSTKVIDKHVILTGCLAKGIVAGAELDHNNVVT